MSICNIEFSKIVLQARHVHGHSGQAPGRPTQSGEPISRISDTDDSVPSTIIIMCEAKLTSVNLIVISISSLAPRDQHAEFMWRPPEQ